MSAAGKGFPCSWSLWWSLVLCFFLLFSGCSSILPQADYDLEKQIERQRRYQLAAEPEPKEILTVYEYEQRGDGYLHAGDVDRAFVSYVRGLTLEPENPSLLHKKGILQLKRKKYKDAETTYRLLLEIDSKDTLAAEGLGRALLGQQRVEEAEQHFRQAVDQNAGLWRSYNCLAMISSSRKNYDQALSWLRKALTVKPQNSSLLNNLGVTYYMLGRYIEAESVLREVISKGSQPKMYNNLALVYLGLDQYELALEAFKKGTSSEAIAYNNIGKEYLARKKYEEAIAAFEQALALKPKFYPSAHKNLEEARQLMAKNAHE